MTSYQLWSTVPPVAVLYDAAASGYTASLAIRASSSTVGTYTFTSTAHDPLRVGPDAAGALALSAPDSLRFAPIADLPGSTHFELAGPQLTLTNPNAHPFTFASGTVQATTRIVCMRPQAAATAEAATGGSPSTTA